MLASEEFYDFPSVYRDSGDFYRLVASKLPPGWRMFQAGYYYRAEPPATQSHAQGWNIQFSSVPNQARTVLSKIASVCVENGVIFEFARDCTVLRLMNSNAWTRDEAGRFATIYVGWEDQFKRLIEVLYENLKGFDGPYILSAKRYKDDCKIVHYAYGSLSKYTQLDPEGEMTPVLVSPEGDQIPDRKKPYFALPHWIRDPFPDLEENEALSDEDLTLKDGRYVPLRARSWSVTGGVYRGIDLHTGEEILISEARPHTGDSAESSSAIAELERVLDLGRKLKDSGFVSEIVDSFWEWEHVFVVQKYVDGESLEEYVERRNPLLKPNPTQEELADYFRSVVKIGIQLARIVEHLEEHGVRLDDSLINAIVIDNNNDLTLNLVDLRFGCDTRANGSALASIATRSMLNEAYLHGSSGRFLAATLLWMICPSAAYLGSESTIQERFLKEIDKDFHLPKGLLNLIREILEDVSNTPSRLVVTRLNNTSVDGVGLKEKHSSDDLDRRCMLELIRSIRKGILASATPERQDRLFPADAYMRNPLSADRGALGVLYALKILGEEVPPEMMRWIFRHELLNEAYPSGLYTGLSGIAWILGEIGYWDEASDAFRLAEKHPLLFRHADIYSGAAGFGLASLYFWLKTKVDHYLATAIKVAEWLDESKREDSYGHIYWEPGKSLGYARGSSGIALFLLYLYIASGEDRYLSLGRRALYFDLSQSAKVRGIITFRKERQSRVTLPYWYAGTAGVGTTLLRYISVTNDGELFSLLRESIPDTMRKYALQPNLFFGLAGLGNFLLDACDLTGNTYYREQAFQIANGISLFALERSEGIVFPGDSLQRASVDLATGSAGIGLFLNRLVHGGSNFNFTLDEMLTTINGSQIGIAQS